MAGRKLRALCTACHFPGRASPQSQTLELRISRSIQQLHWRTFVFLLVSCVAKR